MMLWSPGSGVKAKYSSVELDSRELHRAPPFVDLSKND